MASFAAGALPMALQFRNLSLASSHLTPPRSQILGTSLSTPPLISLSSSPQTIPSIYCGRGDRKTAKGKRFNHSYGNSRPKNKNKGRGPPRPPMPPSQPRKDKYDDDNTKKKKGGLVIDYEALSQHGYSGGLSVLKVPPPVVEDQKKDWSWSTGKDRGTDNRGIEESYEVREQTRAALAEGEKLENARTLKEKNLSFSQKEKRKRELGQASRGKNYVEEEKRLLRESGIYSGFDA